MILLDQNLSPDQRFEFEKRRWPVRHVGEDWGKSSMSDEDIVTALRQSKIVTFFTRDSDFYRRGLCHQRYCLVYVDVPSDAFVAHSLAFLRHPLFRTHAQRMGAVVRLQPTGIVFMQLARPGEMATGWTTRSR